MATSATAGRDGTGWWADVDELLQFVNADGGSQSVDEDWQRNFGRNRANRSYHRRPLDATIRRLAERNGIWLSRKIRQ